MLKLTEKNYGEKESLLFWDRDQLFIRKGTGARLHVFLKVIDYSGVSHSNKKPTFALNGIFRTLQRC